MKKNKGITLIALIITIIILLILVGVSLNLLIKGDLFGSAEKAVEGTNAKVNEQQSRVDELMGKIDQVEAKTAIHNWQYTDNTRAKLRCTCTRCKIFPDGDSEGRTLSVGQQIGETEYITSSTSITAEKSGTYSDQNIDLNNQETKWVVFGYDDEDNDGINETLLITIENPEITTLKVSFENEKAYTDGITEVNRMCKELYGTNARGITIEDIDRVFGYTPTGGMYFDNSKWVTIDNFTTKIKDLGDVWNKIKDSSATYGSNTFYDPLNPKGIKDGGEILGEYLLDYYTYSASSSTAENIKGVPTIPSNIATISKAMIFGEKCEYGYWLVSRSIDVSPEGVGFGIGYVGTGSVQKCMPILVSDGTTVTTAQNLRPLRHLTTDIPEAGNVLFSTFTYKF